MASGRHSRAAPMPRRAGLSFCGKGRIPVSAEEPEHLTSRNRERHGVDRDPIAEPFRQLFDDERRKTRDSLVLANTEVASESA
jgi:hypothetical protein